MSEWLEEFKAKLDSMSREELDNEWEKLEKYNYGPTIEEYFDGLKKWGLISEDF